MRKFWEFSGGPVVRIHAFTAVAWFQSLVRELRSRKPRGEAKKKRKEKVLAIGCTTVWIYLTIGLYTQQ